MPKERRRKTPSNKKPSCAEEKQLWAQGYKLVAGVDEVGRGALAGPVMAAAVILPADIKGSRLSKVRDSKLLTAKQREELYDCVKEAALATGIGSVSNEEIDKVGIAKATQKAMKLAVESLCQTPDYLLIDFFKIPDVTLPQKGVVEGDTLCLSIACASIIAKVSRDRMMTELDEVHPGYNFAEHKGYGTSEHLACLRKLGPSPVHRRSFQPVVQPVMENFLPHEIKTSDAKSQGVD